MPLNITNNFNYTDPIKYVFEPFTNFFQKYLGYGEIFYIIPIITIAIIIWYKTDEPVLVSMFLLASGTILGLSAILINYMTLGIIFIIFAALGLTSLIISFIMQRRER